MNSGSWGIVYGTWADIRSICDWTIALKFVVHGANHNAMEKVHSDNGPQILHKVTRDQHWVGSNMLLGHIYWWSNGHTNNICPWWLTFRIVVFKRACAFKARYTLFVNMSKHDKWGTKLFFRRIKYCWQKRDECVAVHCSLFAVNFSVADDFFSIKKFFVFVDETVTATQSCVRRKTCL